MRHILSSHPPLHSALMDSSLFFVCLFRLSMMSLNARYAFFFFFFSLQLVQKFLCKCVLSKCSYNGRFVGALVFTERVRANEKYISLKTPLPFPWPLWCIYNHFLTALEQSTLPFFPLRARQSSAPMGLQGSGRVQTQVQDILLRGNRKLI